MNFCQKIVFFVACLGIATITQPVGQVRIARKTIQDFNEQQGNGISKNNLIKQIKNLIRFRLMPLKQRVRHVNDKINGTRQLRSKLFVRYAMKLSIRSRPSNPKKTKQFPFLEQLKVNEISELNKILEASDAFAEDLLRNTQNNSSTKL